MAHPVGTDIGVTGAIVTEALSWIGTPYRHQGDCKGVGCDCLGLIRGVWRALYGTEIEVRDDYSPDWAEVRTGENMLAGARRYFHEKHVSTLTPGDMMLFRWRAHAPAKHAGILIEETRFIHAYQGGGEVVMSTLVPQWRRRIAGVFAFPRQ